MIQNQGKARFFKFGDFRPTNRSGTGTTKSQAADLALTLLTLFAFQHFAFHNNMYQWRISLPK